MRHTFNSTNDRPWLKESHQKRSNRSIELGKQVIDLLIEKNEPVTYSNIADFSKKLIPKGKEYIRIPYGQMNNCMTIINNIV
ncbi:hypothetical protein ACT7C8_02295 [Bacillus cereus]